MARIGQNGTSILQKTLQEIATRNCRRTIPRYSITDTEFPLPFFCPQIKNPSMANQIEDVFKQKSVDRHNHGALTFYHSRQK